MTVAAPSWLPRRRWRTWLVIGLIVLLGGGAIAALHKAPANQYLSPGSLGADGTHALGDILAGLGRQVSTKTDARAAIRAVTAGSTLVITSPEYLSGAELSALARVPANVLIVYPDVAALRAMAVPVSLTGKAEPVTVTSPACSLAAATFAGTADMGGRNL